MEGQANMGSSLTDFVRFRPHTYARTQSLPPLWKSIIKVNIRDTATVNATCSQLTIKTRNQHLKRRRLFFLSGFSFANIHDSQDSRGWGRVSI